MDIGLRKRIEGMLQYADVALNGQRPWDIRVKNDHLYRRIFAQGTLGFGEAYMDGWWDTQALDQLVTRLLNARLDQKFKNFTLLVAAAKARLMNRQSLNRAYQVGEKHYNAGNDLYRCMLDSRMIYSCGYWKNADSLDQAQRDKLDLTCRKLQLEPGQKVLDIGCGWGGMARYMAENYGVEVLGITISTEQAKLARENCQGLPVEIVVQDYRELTGRYDRIVSIGMFEHVGSKNYPTYFSKVAELLSDDGLFLLHTIGGNTPANRTEPWIDKYIFPNGMIPSAQQVSSNLEQDFIMEDWHNFGPDYDKTLMAWHANFTQAWPDLQGRYSDRFRRMWEYYLLSCAASFRARSNQVWQIVLSKGKLPGGYEFPR
ncbi:MAG: cyclopropane fatty acyl phospholipid synthase [Desulfuromonadales bacterium]|nr:cyclopropane fatty acyl phospholipid synthase [Desulfuromonadales bacterium]